jgi:hypothetical protein
MTTSTARSILRETCGALIQMQPPLNNSRLAGPPREYLDPIAIQNSHGVGTHKANADQNACCFSLCLIGTRFMIDNPAQDFRVIAATPRAEDVYKIDHALDIDPTGFLVNCNSAEKPEIRLTGGIRCD